MDNSGNVKTVIVRGKSLGIGAFEIPVFFFCLDFFFGGGGVICGTWFFEEGGGLGWIVGGNGFTGWGGCWKGGMGGTGFLETTRAVFGVEGDGE